MDPSASIVYGFEIEDEDLDYEVDLTNENYLDNLCVDAGLIKVEWDDLDWGAFKAYSDKRRAIEQANAKALDWGCDAGESQYVIGVVVANGDWDGAVTLDPKLFARASEARLKVQVTKFCEFLDIEPRTCSYLMLCEES